MTFGEFKAWLSGFEYAWENHTPNVGQWNLIKEKINEVVVPQPLPFINSPLSTYIPCVTTSPVDLG